MKYSEQQQQQQQQQRHLGHMNGSLVNLSRPEAGWRGKIDLNFYFYTSL